MNHDKDIIFKLEQTLLAARMLIVYRNLLNDNLVKEYLDLLEALESDAASDLAVIDAYHTLMYSLISSENGGTWPDAWQRYLVHKILEDENPFSLRAEHTPEKDIESALFEAVIHDLKCLQKLFEFSAGSTRSALLQRVEGKFGRHDLPEIQDWRDIIDHRRTEPIIAQEFYEESDWSGLVSLLAGHYHSYGSGQFAKYLAFRWEGPRGLTGIADPDQPPMGDLVGLEPQKRQLAMNTEYFIKGLPANNVLLYGKRGTGKSSLVKTMLNEYHSQGLRLVELPKQYLQDIAQLLLLLRNRAGRFIIFIDDLSFEEYEIEYKELKAVLEGSLTSIPDNVLVYATSNRRHLIKEFFTDRKLADEIHHDDTSQEKQSIADRFGMTILFPATNQQAYLHIVQELAQRFSLPIEADELRKQALQWEKSHNGPSGRTARQFIENLAAQFGVPREKIKNS